MQPTQRSSMTTSVAAASNSAVGSFDDSCSPRYLTVKLIPPAGNGWAKDTRTNWLPCINSKWVRPHKHAETTRWVPHFRILLSTRRGVGYIDLHGREDIFVIALNQHFKLTQKLVSPPSSGTRLVSSTRCSPCSAIHRRWSWSRMLLSEILEGPPSQVT